MTSNSQIVKKNPSPYNKITGDVATHINKIMVGNYQQAALGTINDLGVPMVSKIIPMNYNGAIYLSESLKDKGELISIKLFKQKTYSQNSQS